MYSHIYQSLKSGFNQSWFKFLFINTKLGKLLAKDEEPSPINFFITYLSSWWWNRLWFRSRIKELHIFEGFNRIIPSLKALKKANILTDDNYNLVAAHTYPYGLSQALCCLQKNGLLTQDKFDLIIDYAHPYYYASKLCDLQKDRILTEDNFKLIRNHEYPKSLIEALSNLQEAKILTQVNIDLVAPSRSPSSFAYLLCDLQKDRMLTEDNFKLIRNHEQPEFLTLALSSLQYAKILTQDNIDLIKNHANPSNLPNVVSHLTIARILTQDNFERLLAPNHSHLISNTSNEFIWSRIPTFFLTQVNFQRLVTAAEHDNPTTEIQRVVDEILGVNRPVAGAGRTVAFNNSQSTHTASVHASVSASALKLMQTYGSNLNLEVKIKEIKDYVNGLAADSPRNQAVKRCIARITAADYNFIDTSGVSTRQLLALAYTAIHDTTKCSADLHDAKALFIEGLYEIQRGYNLTHVGDDQGGDDASICHAGTFNKLMEKLNGIHSDVEVYYITREGASSKLPRLAAAHATTYLKSLATPATAEGYLRIKVLLDNINKNESLEPIWEHIKAEVQAELWEEFKDAYNNERNKVLFLDLINNYQYIKIPNLYEIEAMLFTTSGYKAYLEEQTHLSLGEQRLLLSIVNHSFWANRNLNPEARKKFDEQCGLVLWRK